LRWALELFLVEKVRNSEAPAALNMFPKFDEADCSWHARLCVHVLLG
jgi:hypothetical protein